MATKWNIGAIARTARKARGRAAGFNSLARIE